VLLISMITRIKKLVILIILNFNVLLSLSFSLSSYKKRNCSRVLKVKMSHSKSDEKKFNDLLSETPMQIDSIVSCFSTHLFCNVLVLEAGDVLPSLPRDEGSIVMASFGVQNELLQGISISQQVLKEKLVDYLTFGMSLSVLLRSGDYVALIAGLDSVMKEYAQWIELGRDAASLHPEKFPNLRPYRIAFAEGLDFKQVVLCVTSLFKQFYMKFDSFSSDIVSNKQQVETVVRFDQFVRLDFLKFVVKVMGEVSRVVVGNALSDRNSIYSLNQAWQSRKVMKAKRAANPTAV